MTDAELRKLISVCAGDQVESITLDKTTAKAIAEELLAARELTAPLSPPLAKRKAS